MFRIVPNKKDRCCAHGCKNLKTKKDRFCGKHRHRFNKAVNPIRYTYNSLKSNARRRGHEFDLTIFEFERFCQETGYMELKGKLPGSASIDRMDCNKGYTYENIQILTLRQNSIKQNRVDYGNEQIDDLPF